MKIVVIKPGEQPEVTDTAIDLERLQRLVGGYIETFRWIEEYFAIVNEDGSRLGLPYNSMFSRAIGAGAEIVGTVVIVKRAFSEIVGLTDDECAEVMQRLSGR